MCEYALWQMDFLELKAWGHHRPSLSQGLKPWRNPCRPSESWPVTQNAPELHTRSLVKTPGDVPSSSVSPFKHDTNLESRP